MPAPGMGIHKIHHGAKTQAIQYIAKGAANHGTQRQRQTLRGLGFRKLYQTVEVEDSPSVRGMITAIAHLVKVQE